MNWILYLTATFQQVQEILKVTVPPCTVGPAAGLPRPLSMGEILVGDKMGEREPSVQIKMPFGCPEARVVENVRGDFVKKSFFLYSTTGHVGWTMLFLLPTVVTVAGVVTIVTAAATL